MVPGDPDRALRERRAAAPALLEPRECGLTLPLPLSERPSSRVAASTEHRCPLNTKSQVLY